MSATSSTTVDPAGIVPAPGPLVWLTCATNLSPTRLLVQTADAVFIASAVPASPLPRFPVAAGAGTGAGDSMVTDADGVSAAGLGAFATRVGFDGRGFVTGFGVLAFTVGAL